MEQLTSVLRTSENIDQLAEALSLAQGEIEAAARDSENPYFSSSYSSLAALKAVARPHLAKNRLAVFQAAASELQDQSGKVYITTRVAHSSGQWAESTLTMPVLPMARKRQQGDSDADRAPGKITAQAVGSAITYGMRYSYSAMVGVVPDSDDDDGNAASAGGEADALPIPANGYFEDTILSVVCEVKDKRDGSGSFTICTVETGKHGKLECWESVGEIARSFAGTGTMCELTAERSKFGMRLKNARAKQLAPGEAEFLEVKQAVEAATSLDELTVLKGKYKDKAGPYWTGNTFELFRVRGRELGAPEAKPKETPVSEILPVHVEAWIREIKTCPDRGTFAELEERFLDSVEIKSNPECRGLLNEAGKRLKVEGYYA